MYAQNIFYRPLIIRIHIWLANVITTDRWDWQKDAKKERERLKGAEEEHSRLSIEDGGLTDTWKIRECNQKVALHIKLFH